MLLFSSSIFFGATVTALEDEESIDVVGQVPGCVFEFNVRPEKRIPQTNHWQNQYLITFYKSATDLFYYQFNVATDQFGIAQVDLCNENLDFETGNYDVVIKGLSHLSRRYDEQLLFYDHYMPLDYSVVNLQLSGDLNEDNRVSLLDLEIIKNDIYGTTIKNDLNRDGVVNSLDISNLIFNLDLEGEE